MKGRLPKADLAYLAGYLDADGSIGIYENRSPLRTNQSSTYYLTVRWSTANRDQATWIALKVRPNNPAAVTRRSTISGRYYYDVVLSNDTGLAILSKLMPYLKVKREQAEWAVQFRDYIKSYSNPKNWGRGRIRPWFRTATLALFKQRMHHLNSLNQGELVPGGSN